MLDVVRGSREGGRDGAGELDISSAVIFPLSDDPDRRFLITDLVRLKFIYLKGVL